jgi:RimJ/RimL family protein N-acetyltransferase
MRDEPDLVDVGWGLRPDLLGRGLGPRLIEAALVVHAGARHRIAVYDWNARAKRAPAKCGFVHTGERVGDFVLMERQPSASSAATPAAGASASPSAE